MNPLNVFFSRLYQGVLKLFIGLFKIPEPKIIDKMNDIIPLLKENNCHHPLFVVSNSVLKQEYTKDFLKNASDNGITIDYYNKVTPDPTIDLITDLVEEYKNHDCDSIIACGGGSVMDASKVMGAVVVSKKRVEKLKGMQHVGKKIPYFVAIPTTAGTGSEATVAAVITNTKTNDKFAVTDIHFVPDVAVLDDALLKTLPKSIIRNSGMDAFCHAIEAFISRMDTKEGQKYALQGIKLIKESLFDFYNDSLNDVARKNMLYGSYYAGLSMTRQYVGYVHAISHAIGGYYHLPHGYLIGISLPYVLEAYGKKAYAKLALIYDSLFKGLKTKEEKALYVINYIKELNKSMDMPENLGKIIKESDFDTLAIHAAKEANPSYPVPLELSKEEIKKLIIKING